MKETKLKYLDEPIYYEKLSNGLQVYIIPKHDVKNYDVNLTVKYGSCDTNYFIGKKEYSDPLGTAHYLEHQLFNMEDEKSFSKFSSYGTIANASTSYFVTKYYISGTKSFKDNFNYFLKMLFTPFFTDESIEKERGIIEEEIKMNDDDIYWIMDNKTRNNLFNVHPIKNKIAGTIDSIKEITKEDLYRVYNYFYIPNNMILTISGNVDKDLIMDILHNNKLLDIKNHKIVRKEYNESPLTFSEYGELYDNVTIPKLDYCFKIDKSKIKIKDKYLVNMYLSTLFYLIFDEISLFKEEVYSNNYCSRYDEGCSFVDKYCIFSISADSVYADLFKDTVDKYLSSIKVSSEELDRVKKINIAGEIRNSDNVTRIARFIQNNFIMYNKVYLDNIKYIKKMNIDELNEIIKSINFDNNSFVLMLPKNND